MNLPDFENSIIWSWNGQISQWHMSSDVYLFLGPLLIDFDFTFNQTICERSKKFELTKEQKQFLIKGTAAAIRQLLENYNPDKEIGLNFTKKTFEGIEYNLYSNYSRRHKIASFLISFHNKLTDSMNNKESLTCHGTEDGKAINF